MADSFRGKKIDPITGNFLPTDSEIYFSMQRLSSFSNAAKKDIRKVGSVMGLPLVVDLSSLRTQEERDNKYYEVRRMYDEIVGSHLKRDDTKKA